MNQRSRDWCLVLITLSVFFCAVLFTIWYFDSRSVSLQERELKINNNKTRTNHNNVFSDESTSSASKQLQKNGVTKGIGYVGLVQDSEVNVMNTVNTTNKTLESNTSTLVSQMNTTTATVDPNNSSTDLLDASATFTGTATDVSAYAAIAINLKANQNGTLFIDFSPDASNWDNTTVVAYTANADYTNRVVVIAQYFRLRFNNSGSAQTVMRLQSILGNQSIAQEAASIDTTGLAVSGIISSANSTTTTLAGSATYTGSAVDVTAYSIVVVNVIADQTGTLFIEFSSDAINWDLFKSETINANSGESFSVNVEARYCRIRFTNDSATPQTYFRLQTIVSVGTIDTGFVSELNSTYTPLSASATFTGTWENVAKYATVTVNGSTDQNATLYVQFSADGSTILSNLQMSSGTDSNLGLHTLIVATKYFRVRIVNGSINMGSLTVQSTFSENSKIAIPTSRLNSAFTDYSSVINTRAVGFGEKPDGTYALTKQTGQRFETSSTLQGTLLNGALNDSATTVTVDSTTGFDSSGLISIEDEMITYTGLTDTTFTGCTRGANSTTAATHDDNTAVGKVYKTGILDIDGYTQVQTHILSSHNGKLIIRWYRDDIGNDIVRELGILYTSAEGFRLYSAPVFSQYNEYIFYHQGGTDQTDFFLDTRFLNQSLSAQILALDAFIAPSMVANVTRSVLTAQKPNSQYSNVRMDAVGNLDVNIDGPLMPFNSLHTESFTPVFQVNGVYGINPLLMSDSSNGSSLGGSASIVNSAFSCNTTTNIFGNATLQSVKRLKYRPGQGSIMRFTAKFTAGGAANTYQVVGMGHPEDGYYIGYKDTTFGILAVSRNLRETATLTISGGATSAEDCTITLGGTAFTVPLTNASGNINRTVWDIARFDYDGWSAEPLGATVIFLAGGSGVKTNTYTFAAGSTGATSSSFTRTRAGDKTTYPETFIPQTSFNADVLDGTGSSANPSNVLLDTSTFNLFQIGMQYLGAGSIKFSIMTTDQSGTTGGNKTRWITFHIIDNVNTLSLTHVGNPSFPFTMSAYKLNSATDLTLQCGSVLAGVEGKVVRTGPLVSYRVANTSIDTGAIRVLFVIYNMNIFNDVPNQSVITLRSMSAAANGSNNTVTSIYIIKNGTITGNPVFSNYDDTRSCALFSETTDMDVTFSNNSQLVYSGSLSADDSINIDFDSESEEFDVQPGDYIVVGVQLTAGTGHRVAVSLNTREDH